MWQIGDGGGIIASARAVHRGRVGIAQIIRRLADVSVRDSLKLLLEKDGYRVTTVANGRSAVDVILKASSRTPLSTGFIK